jgi:dipeptidyl aminopeptidase/acylaminoacyl peptidase
MPGDGVFEITVNSSIDGSQEPCLLYLPAGAGPLPLVVGLHTWSHDRFNQVNEMLPFCRERGWALLLPEFRGPNLASNPRARQACGSAVARQDVLDAVDSVVAGYPLNAANIFLLGGSGGGHLALLLAARAPHRWKGVSAWVPITDLAAWHHENPDYAANLAACCGGNPGDCPDADREYRERSPLSHVQELANATISLHHGRYDPVVPYRQSWRLALELERLGAPHFFFEIFDGGHDIRYDRAFAWFDRLTAGVGFDGALSG